jgi:hypothetical protein
MRKNRCGRHGRSHTSSVLRVPIRLSIGELSYQLPTLFMLGPDTVSLHRGLIGMLRVLTAPIRVVDETSLWLASLDGQLQHSQCHIASHGVRHGPTEDSMAVQV